MRLRKVMFRKNKKRIKQKKKMRNMKMTKRQKTKINN